MKRLLSIFLIFVCMGTRAADTDWLRLLMAATDAVTAATLDDNDVKQLCEEAMAQYDAENNIDKGKYASRLARLTKGFTLSGVQLNFKAYKSKEINAFACGDGSVRINTGLMDIMADNELVAIIGHEIGHIANKDTKKALQTAYATSAARNAVGASESTAGTIARGLLGGLAELYLNTRYSRKQEYAADMYGHNFAIQHGYSKDSMASALENLLKVADRDPLLVEKMFSSHPGTKERAERLRNL